MDQQSGKEQDLADAAAGPGLRGVVAPILTPYENSGEIAKDLWCGHARNLLNTGAHLLSPFGTTGEALSNSVRERMQALEWLADGGIDPAKLMPGTGITALPETIDLCRHAHQTGVAAMMVLPSFYYKAAGQEGQYRYFSEVIEGVGDAGLRVCLYNIPQVAGVGVSPELAGRLARAFPEQVVAYKDSCGDWDHTKAVIAAAPKLAVFPGSEVFLNRALEQGGAGCISALVNVNAAGIRAVYDGGGDHDKMLRIRELADATGAIATMKSALARRSGDTRWLNLRAPFLNATAAQGEALFAAL